MCALVYLRCVVDNDISLIITPTTTTIITTSFSTSYYPTTTSTTTITLPLFYLSVTLCRHGDVSLIHHSAAPAARVPGRRGPREIRRSLPVNAATHTYSTYAIH